MQPQQPWQHLQLPHIPARALGVSRISWMVGARRSRPQVRAGNRSQRRAWRLLQERLHARLPEQEPECQSTQRSRNRLPACQLSSRRQTCIRALACLARTAREQEAAAGTAQGVGLPRPVIPWRPRLPALPPPRRLSQSRLLVPAAVRAPVAAVWPHWVPAWPAWPRTRSGGDWQLAAGPRPHLQRRRPQQRRSLCTPHVEEAW
mmetsp:Transcript_53404/g.140087  ORF Transcript_53404/g.140087 Transcript_53404/m.140087 type:complete len:204 (-) Transcript_53404:120-731(-)